MRFVQQSLRNICQLSSLDWTFRNGLIGIYGPVGSGKSNAMLVAPYVALTGRYDRHPEGKNGLLKRGARDGHIELTIECAGQPLVVRVALMRGRREDVVSEITLTLPDGKQLTGATQVYETLQTAYKLDAAVLDEYVLVRQRALNDLIAQTSAERIKALGRLCGTDRAELVYRALGDRLTTLSATAQGLAFTQDDTAQALSAARGAYRKSRQAYQTAKAAIPAKSARATAARCLEAAEQRKKLRQATIALRAQLEEADAAGREVCATYATAVKEFRQSCETAKAKKTQALQLRQTLRACHAMAAHKARYAKARARVRTLQQQLDELIAPALPQHATYEAEVDARKARDKALVELAQAQSLLTLTGKSACTVCGTPVKTLATAMEAAKQQASALRRRLTDVEKYLGTMLTYREAYAAYDTARLTINATLAAHTASMNKLAKQAKTKQRLPELDATRTACSARIAEYNKLRQTAVDLGRQGRKAWQAAQTAISTQRQLQTQIARLQTTLPAKQTAAALTAARELLQTAKLRRREAAAVRETYVGAKAVYIAAKAAHARDARARKMREQLQQWIDKLGKCRAYAHRDGLPQRVHTAALQLLEKRINPLLAALDAPFEVTADPQSARLLAVMQDGETFPTEALSGGQTVSLSIAYRLAVKELFAKHFDMLVLDEPTSWLDTRRMDCLMEVMMRLRRRAAQLNQQIIVVTHSDRLRRVFDQVLETV